MFWVSDAYYVILAPVLRVFPATVETGRWVSFVAVLAASAGFFTAGRKAGAHPVAAAAVAGVWLLMPKVVVAANVARHEGIVLGCVAWALVAVFSGRRVAAVTLGVFAAVLHPAGIAFAAVIVLAVLVCPAAKATTKWEWAGAAALTAFVGFEVVHFVSNWGIATEQIRFQLARKGARVTPAIDFGFALGLLGSLGLLVRLRRHASQPAVVFLGVAFGGAAVSAFGHEMWYGVYGLPTGALVLALGALVLVPRLDASWQRSAQLATLAFATLVVFGTQGYGVAFYGMRIDHDQTELATFVADVRAQLVALDEQTSEPTTVALNALSGLPWPLQQERFGNVTLVKETAVSAATNPDYRLYARTACCTGKIEATEPLGEVVATVASPHDLFDATLFKTTPE